MSKTRARLRAETQYEGGIDKLRHDGLAEWRRSWSTQASALEREAAADGRRMDRMDQMDGVYQIMAMRWPDAMMKKAWAGSKNQASLDWESPTAAEMGFSEAELQRGAYVFGWALSRARDHVADRLLLADTGLAAEVDALVLETLLSVRVTVEAAKAAPKAAHLSLVLELDRAKTQTGGLCKLDPVGQRAMLVVATHFQKWLTFRRMAALMDKGSLLQQVIRQTREAAAVRDAFEAMLPTAVKAKAEAGGVLEKVISRLTEDAITSYARMEGRSFASDINDELSNKLQTKLVRGSVTMLATWLLTADVAAAGPAQAAQRHSRAEELGDAAAARRAQS